MASSVATPEKAPEPMGPAIAALVSVGIALPAPVSVPVGVAVEKPPQPSSSIAV